MATPIGTDDRASHKTAAHRTFNGGRSQRPGQGEGVAHDEQFLLVEPTDLFDLAWLSPQLPTADGAGKDNEHDRPAVGDGDSAAQLHVQAGLFLCLPQCCRLYRLAR